MKVFTFKYEPGAKKIGALLGEAVKGKHYVKPHEMSCTDIRALMQVASQARLEIFEAIVKFQPSSLYELAEKTGKSQPFILKESRALELLGLIKLHREKVGGRERLKPEPLYSKIIIEYGFGGTRRVAS